MAFINRPLFVNQGDVELMEVETKTKPVRLDLVEQDFEQLERCARRMGLTKASYARMAVLERIRADLAKAQ